MADLTFLLLLFAFGLSFQLGLNRSLLRKARADADAQTQIHPDGEAPPVQQKLIDPKFARALRSWPRTLIWQYCCLMAFAAFELLIGIEHSQIFLDIGTWALAFVAIDVGIMFADLITLVLIWRGRNKSN
jgi:hypothetical protein